MSSILKALQRLQGERGGAGAQPALRDDLAREVTAHRAEPAGAAPPEEAPSATRWPVLAVVVGLALAAMTVAGFFAARTLGRTPPPVAVAAPPAPAAVEPDPTAAPVEGEPWVREALPARPSAPPEEAPTLPASIVPPSEGAPAEPEGELATAETAPVAELVLAPAASPPAAGTPSPAAPAAATLPAPAFAPATPPAPAFAPATPPAPAFAPATPPAPAFAPATPPAAPPAAAPSPASVETPHIELAEPGASPPASAVAETPAFDPSPPPEVSYEPAEGLRAPAPRRREPDFAVVTPPPEITVLRTSWHPRPERRVARVRLGGSSAPVEVHEGDALSTLVVKAIEPSGVVFLHGGRELRRGVGGE